MLHAFDYFQKIADVYLIKCVEFETKKAFEAKPQDKITFAEQLIETKYLH